MNKDKIKQLKEAKLLFDENVINEVEFNKIKSDLMKETTSVLTKSPKKHRGRTMIIVVFIMLFIFGGGISAYIVKENHEHELQNKTKKVHKKQENPKNKIVNNKESISGSSEETDGSEASESNSTIATATPDYDNGITTDEAYAKVDLVTQGHGADYIVTQKSKNFYKYVSTSNPNYVVTIALNTTDSSKLDVTFYGGASTGPDGYSETMSR